MKPIGGYFGLELKTGNEMYGDLTSVNSARNALVCVVRERRIRVLNMPHFNCHVVADAVKRFCPDTVIKFYHIDQAMDPVDDDIDADAPLYRVNYYNLFGRASKTPSGAQAILDNAQAFYSPPPADTDTIYCPRKFFGVSDGAYLSSSATVGMSMEPDDSWDRSAHLLRRLDGGAEAGYSDFQAAEAALLGRPPMGMSRLSRTILSSIDHARVIATRRRNFGLLHAALARDNRLKDAIESAQSADDFVPFCYPFMTANAEQIRDSLIERRIYVPVYWPELRSSTDLNDHERAFASDIVSLPIDQRYGDNEMAEIVAAIFDDRSTIKPREQC